MAGNNMELSLCDVQNNVLDNHANLIHKNSVIGKMTSLPELGDVRRNAGESNCKNTKEKK